MRSGVPWSVKGIEPEAREAAKQAAHRAGVTLGAWLNQIIMDAGTDEVGKPTGEPRSAQPQSGFAQPAFHQPVPQISAGPAQIDMTPVAEAMRDIVQRVETSERRTADLARRLEQSVGQLAERLEYSERAMEQSSEAGMIDPLERRIQQLAERLEETERSRGARRPDDKAIQTLEKAVTAVVDHLDTAERRTDESLAEIRQALSQLTSRVDERDEEKEREAELARARAVENHLQTLATRLEKMEHSVGGIGPQAVEAAMKAIAEKSDAEQHKATIAGVQSNLAEITQRLERAESRTEETLKAFEKTVASIARRLEDMDRPRNDALPEAMRVIESRIEQMADRLQQNEDMTAQAAQSIERAIAGMSDNLHVTENRSRETVESLHVMLERMTERLAKLEQDAKAARSNPVLPPQIATGYGAGNGFVPSGQPFAVPNFDMPPSASFGGAAGGLLNNPQGSPLGNPLGNPFGDEPGTAGFRNPFADVETPRSLPPAPPPSQPLAQPLPEHAGDVPPPFALQGDEERREPTLDTRGAGAEEAPDSAGEPEMSNPTAETARAANDFLAAARRAAQAAAQAGRSGPQPMLGNAGFGEHPARFTAIAPERESRRKKILVGGFAALLVLAAGLAATRVLNNEPAIPQPVIVDSGPANSASPKTEKPADETANAARASATSVDPESNPAEASPEGAGATATAPQGQAAPGEMAAPAPATTSETESPIVPAPKKAARPQTTILPRPVERAPSATPAPAKPVESEPLAPAATPSGTPSAMGTLGRLPASQRALGEAARNGDAVAQYELAQRYANGDGVDADPAQAAIWYGKAADQGLAIAQYRLATLYEKGRGVAQNDSMARSLYEKAALQGNVKAMHNLAVIYAEGRGTRQDFTTAARWFGEAAAFGLGDSQYNLAILEERGLGVKQDLGSAYKWLSIAAKAGDRGAAQKRDELEGKLDAAVLAQAKVAAETWAAKRPDPAANGDLGTFHSGAAAGNPDDITGSISTTVSDTARAQAMLMQLGYDPGTSDGVMGPRTRDAILAYQRSADLDQTGSVNPALLKSLELATR
ncbi:MAG TPA: peptidoglycan-binding protein [Parvibaculum sp.]|uniref:peptidoglycan-binding protein n=1 Tax=Parvibaculum sp. TaxID=2024848 RepID=UPI002CC6894F|nr:peptidoglycan-binding protein [Parvibaculum sp.]HMM14466.1 peptidoglycan-binding protein [Parvibaculum sp.]